MALVRRFAVVNSLCKLDAIERLKYNIKKLEFVMNIVWMEGCET